MPGVTLLGLGILQTGGDFSQRQVASTHEIFYGSLLPLPLLPALQPVFYRIPRQRETEPRARMFYFLNFGCNHERDYYKLLDEVTGKVVYTCDVTWHHPEVPWITPSSMWVAPTEPPKGIYVSVPKHIPVDEAPPPTPVPAPKTPPQAPTTAPVPSPTTAMKTLVSSEAPALIPHTASKPSAPIPACVRRLLEHEGYQEISWRTRRKTRRITGIFPSI